MSQHKYIQDIAKYGLENDQQNLLETLKELIQYSKSTRKTNLALQLQSILKDGIRNQETTGLLKVGSTKHILREQHKEIDDFIIEKVTSDYVFTNLVCSDEVRSDLEYFVQEHNTIEELQKFSLPISNKVIFYGPSGCGKTLASFVLAGELNKIMYVINLGSIVSSKLGETSKNLAKIFRRAATEDCIIFIDEFDSLGKVRDYNQDHGEMKRVVNTILQLFDYLPQRSIVIAATNHVDYVDNALLRRFDLKINLTAPNESQIKTLINNTLQKGAFNVDKRKLNKVIKVSLGMSYYSIQKTLINTIKRSLFNVLNEKRAIDKQIDIDVDLWIDQLNREKASV